MANGFSPTPDPDEIYRFRSVHSLIGPFKELYRQTIYLAKPDQLNDVAEDTVNVVWQGDSILWSNLFSYYWRSLVASWFTGDPSNPFLPGYHTIGLNTALPPQVEAGALKLSQRYVSQRTKALMEITNEDGPVPYYKLQPILNSLTPPRNHPSLPFTQSLPNDFSERFVQSMGKLLLSEWIVACFTKDFTNPYLWATYGDNNTGVCLVFDKQALAGIRSPEHSMGVEIEDVVYRRTKPEIEFFSNLPKITVDEYRKLFTDANGNVSPLCPFLPEDRVNAQKVRTHQMEISRTSLLTKQKQWEPEQEVRMFSLFHFPGEMDNPPHMHTIQYPIGALKGIIFGSRIREEDKQAILEVILSKHYASPLREDFSIAVASQRPDGTVRRELSDSLIGWRDEFKYPRKRESHFGRL